MTESLDALREALGRALDLAAAWRDVTDETLGRTTSGGSAQLDFMHDEMTDLREIYVQSEARVRAEVAAEGRTAALRQVAQAIIDADDEDRIAEVKVDVVTTPGYPHSSLRQAAYQALLGEENAGGA